MDGKVYWINGLQCQFIVALFLEHMGLILEIGPWLHSRSNRCEEGSSSSPELQQETCTQMEKHGEREEIMNGRCPREHSTSGQN